MTVQQYLGSTFVSGAHLGKWLDADDTKSAN